MVSLFDYELFMGLLFASELEACGDYRLNCRGGNLKLMRSLG